MKKHASLNFKGWLPCAVAALIPVLTSCQTSRHLGLEPGGPRPVANSAGALDLIGIGYLQVYSGTELRRVGRPKYYPHTDYTIYSNDGKVVEQVANASGPTDETPALVRLPAGFYKIEAEDDDYGRVTVPIVVESGRTTLVRLSSSDTPNKEQQHASNVVRLPDGRWVGWRAQEPVPAMGH